MRVREVEARLATCVAVVIGLSILGCGDSADQGNGPADVEEAARVIRAHSNALADGDGEKLCSNLSPKAQRQMEQAARRAPAFLRGYVQVSGRKVGDRTMGFKRTAPVLVAALVALVGCGGGDSSGESGGESGGGKFEGVFVDPMDPSSCVKWDELSYEEQQYLSRELKKQLTYDVPVDEINETITGTCQAAASSRMSATVADSLDALEGDLGRELELEGSY